ncbi:MAG: bifunctional diaminohydroxyphosphoribosylaminopyrimidine deaminase/5-amino-6-(5-phosphoribosylamino)uracil reductase RibD [Candidatus Omnitrophota bacterium]
MSAKERGGPHRLMRGGFARHCGEQDLCFMRRALELAKRGEGSVHPNPMVGAVLVKNNRVIGEGAHERFGGPHAEANALRKAGSGASGATLYVTLEPCAHFGKTPPCVDLILRHKIKKVVVAARDPNPLVSGKGLRKLRKAGVRVETGVLEAEAERMNRAYGHWIRKKTPYVIVKVAQSLDGRITARPGQPRWITGGEARKFSHGLRAASDAVLVGVNTVLKDDPRLNVRFGHRGRAPLKIVLDSGLRTPPDARIFSSQKKPILAVTRKAPLGRFARYKHKAEILSVPERGGRVDLKALLKLLGRRGVVQLMIEGGGEVIREAFARNVVNEVYLFIAPSVLGGRHEAGPVNLSRIRDFQVSAVGKDLLIHGVL